MAEPLRLFDEEWDDSDDESLKTLEKKKIKDNKSKRLEKVIGQLKDDETKKRKFDEPIPEVSQDLSSHKVKRLTDYEKYDKKELSLDITEELSTVNQGASTSSALSSSTKMAYYMSQGIPKFTFYTSDYERLREGKWINDRIIDWYLMYLHEKVLSDRDRRRTLIFNSQFFTTLLNESFESQQNLTTKYVKARKFVEHGVNIFNKDFLIIPVNEEGIHWYLIIICFPGRVGFHQMPTRSSSDESSSSDNGSSFELKKPCILVFDSLEASSKNDDIEIIRNYLSFEYNQKYNQNISFEEHAIRCLYPEIPRQKIFADCGVFVLQYVEYFFKDPIKIYKMPLRSLKNWFTPLSVIRKRAYLAYKLQKMHLETIGKTTSFDLPDLRFPSLEATDIEELIIIDM